MPEIRHYSLSDTYVFLGKISRDILYKGLLHHTEPKSLGISKCNPPQLQELGAVQLLFSSDANYVAEIVIDIQKALPIINQSDFPVHIEILGNYMSESYKKDYTLSFRKIENIQPLFIPIKNLIWGRDAECGTIEFKSNGTLPNKPWMYTKEINEIRFSRDSGFAIEGSASEGNDFVYRFNPWESRPINVQYDFANRRKKGRITVPFKWQFNGKEITSTVEFTTLDIDSSIEFSTRTDLKWGTNRDCGVLKVIPNKFVNNPLLYLYDRNVLKIEKNQGFSIDGAREEGQYYVVEIDPRESKTIEVSYNFPDRPINQKEYFTFEYVYNGRVKNEKVVYYPIKPTLNIELSKIPKSICISEKNQIIAIVKINKNSIYEADYDNIVCSVDRKDLVTVERSSNTDFKIILKGESFKQLPDEDEKVKVDFFDRNQSKSASFVFSRKANTNNNGANHIQLMAQDGLRVVLDHNPVVVYMPVDKVEVRYKIINETNHDVVITTPTELGTIAPNASIQSSVFVKPTVEEQSIQVYAEYMKPVEERYTMELKEKQDIQYKREFVPSEGLFMDTKYEKQLCGTLLLKWDCDKKILDSYSDTRIKIEMDQKNETYQFLSDIDEITIKSTDVSPKEIPIYLTCEPLTDEELVFGCKINGMQYASSHKIKLSPKDYNIDKLSLIPFAPNGEFYLRGKEPIPIGILKVDKTWEKDGRNKYKILKWNNNNEGEARYVIKNVDEPVESDANEDSFILPERFYMESDMDKIQSLLLPFANIIASVSFIALKKNIEESLLKLLKKSNGEPPSTIDNKNVLRNVVTNKVLFFNAYEYFKDNPEKLNQPIDFWIERKWNIPVFSKTWKANNIPTITCIDPDLVISIVDGNGNTCERNDDNSYCLNVRYTESEKVNIGLVLCQVNVENPSVLNDKKICGLTVHCDCDNLISPSCSSVHIPVEGTQSFEVRMSWKEYEKMGRNIFDFYISGDNIDTINCKVVLNEDRIDDVYSIDLGTSGIVVGKMSDYIPQVIKLDEKNYNLSFEKDSEDLISSKVFIIDDDGTQRITISPEVASVKDSGRFIFCPTKFMVGLKEIPYFSKFIQKNKLSNIDFNLNQPNNAMDDDDYKKEINYCCGNTSLSLNPETFIQNVYSNIFNRIKDTEPTSIRKLVLTYPNTYTSEDLDGLRTVIEKRFPHLDGYIKFVPESDAVVAFYLQKCLDCPNDDTYKKIPEGHTKIVIYDMGAGTLDMNLVVVEKEVITVNNKKRAKVHATITKRMGIPIAGDYLTCMLLEKLKLTNDEDAKLSSYYKKSKVEDYKKHIDLVDFDNDNGDKDQSSKKYSNDISDTIFDTKITDEIEASIDNYLSAVVGTAFDTLLCDDTKIDRIVMSGRACLFKPIKKQIEERFKNSGDKTDITLLTKDSTEMKTSVAVGALLYNSIFSDNDVRFIISFNRYHKVGIVSWATDSNGDDCAQYVQVINPSEIDWSVKEERNGMLCSSFYEEKNVDHSNTGFYSYIIECDLPESDIVELYNNFYRNRTNENYKKDDLRWAFVNEIRKVPQKGNCNTKVTISIEEGTNHLSIHVGSSIGEDTLTEKIENNPFFEYGEITINNNN